MARTRPGLRQLVRAVGIFDGRLAGVSIKPATVNLPHVLGAVGAVRRPWNHARPVLSSFYFPVSPYGVPDFLGKGPDASLYCAIMLDKA